MKIVTKKLLILFEICMIISLFIIILAMTKYRSTTVFSFMPETFNQPVTITHVIKLERRRILQEMDNFEYPSGRFGVDAEKLLDLTPETGGTPVRSVIISTWRSGSTFLGDILSAMPGSFYHYEPLLPFGATQIHGQPNDTKVIRNLIKLLNCDYSDMDEYLEYEKKNHQSFHKNHHLSSTCLQYPQFCYESQFLTPFCKLFPLQSMKIVRLRLALAEQLLVDRSLNVRIVLLVRDPRGTMLSRKRLQWCRGYPDCEDASYLCKDLVSNYNAAEIFYKKFPNRFRAVRYEDLSGNPHNMSRDIFQFYGLPFDHRIEKYLDVHTKIKKGGEYSTFRDSKSTPFHWIKVLKWFHIEEIEKSCSQAMDLWGYRKVNDSKDLSETFDPILPGPFT